MTVLRRFLLQFFVLASVVSYVTFVLSLFVSHLAFFWCLRKAVLRGCGISWVSALIFWLPFEKEPTLKEKYLLPLGKGSKFFPFRVRSLYRSGLVW